MVTLVFAGFFTAGFWYYSSAKTQQSRTLNDLWSAYKKTYIEAGTNRTINRQEKDITTSEGQSYTQLRAAWIGDKETFDQSWNWTKINLGRPNDGLFSWLYGYGTAGQLGILTDKGGQNTATDADIDIAHSLILAHRKWKDPKYLADAKIIINDIWNLEVVQSTPTNKLILVGNNVEKQFNKAAVVVNPSYFSPVAMREFAKIDTSHDWNKLIDDSYELLNKATLENIDKNKSAKLPPDWINVNLNTFQISRNENKDFTTNYGFDAVRIPWRIGLDLKLNRSPQAREYLKNLDYLKSEWNNKGKIYGVYGHDGEILGKYETNLMYACSLGFFANNYSNIADDIYKQKLEPILSTDLTQLSYYDANWIWFGLALYYDYSPE